MRGRLKHLVINYLIRHLLVAVSIDDLLRQQGMSWFIGKHRLSAEELADLKNEAEQLLDSEIWKIMTREMKFHSNLNMFERAKVSDDMLFGKAMLYNWELAKKFLDRVASL